jgi:hypothetical protein
LSDAKGTTTAEVNTYFSFKGKPKNHILLAKTIVEVRKISGQYVPCRAFLDSASQSHFIRQMCTTFEIIKDPNKCIYSGY